MVIHAVLDEDYRSTTGGNAYVGIARTRIWELEKFEKAGKITNLKVTNLVSTQEKKNRFSFSLSQKHNYSAVVSHCKDCLCLKVHMMRPQGNKQITFLVPKNKQTVQETRNEIIITI